MARPYQVRCFDSLLKSRIKNLQMRQKIYKNLLTRLVQDERVVTTLAKCQDLSRVAERMIDLAKQGDEATIYTWINTMKEMQSSTMAALSRIEKRLECIEACSSFSSRKEIIPKVFEDFVQRYNHVGDNYTIVYKLPPRKLDSAQMGVVEFKGNKLPKLLLTDEQLRELAVNKTQKEESLNIAWKGTPV